MNTSEKIAVTSVATVLVKFFMAGLAFKWGDKGMTIGSVDGMVIAAILTPTLGAVHLGSYVAGKSNVSKEEGQQS